MKAVAAPLATLLLCAAPLQACPQCRPLVQAGIRDGFALNLALLLLPLGALLAIAGALYFFDSIGKAFQAFHSWRTTGRRTTSASSAGR